MGNGGEGWGMERILHCVVLKSPGLLYISCCGPQIVILFPPLPSPGWARCCLIHRSTGWQAQWGTCPGTCCPVQGARALSADLAGEDGHPCCEYTYIYHAHSCNYSLWHGPSRIQKVHVGCRQWLAREWITKGAESWCSWVFGILYNSKWLSLVKRFSWKAGQRAHWCVVY